MIDLIRRHRQNKRTRIEKNFLAVCRELRKFGEAAELAAKQLNRLERPLLVMYEEVLTKYGTTPEDCAELIKVRWRLNPAYRKYHPIY